MSWQRLQVSVGLRRRWAVGALAALVLATGGCGGDEENEQAAGGAGGTTTDQTAAEQDSKPAQQDSGEVLASRESASLGEPVRLDIIELRRSGATMALGFELTLRDQESSGPTVGGTFDDGEGLLSPSLDGISLIDTKNRKRYLVARDSKGNCVCDGNLLGVSVKPGGPLVLSATFGAPPEDVEAVDVLIPTFGTFKDVPIS